MYHKRNENTTFLNFVSPEPNSCSKNPIFGKIIIQISCILDKHQVIPDLLPVKGAQVLDHPVFNSHSDEAHGGYFFLIENLAGEL